MALVDGIWQYEETDAIAPTFSDYMNLGGDSVRARFASTDAQVDQLASDVAAVDAALDTSSGTLVTSAVFSDAVSYRYNGATSTLRGRLQVATTIEPGATYVTQTIVSPAAMPAAMVGISLDTIGYAIYSGGAHRAFPISLDADGRLSVFVTSASGALGVGAILRFGLSWAR